jgi:uncharacterized membrane protein YgaE (UPF0421/DUF939 family)
MNNVERYMNLKRKKRDFFPREVMHDPKKEEKFRRPTAMKEEDKEWNKTRKELLLMVEKKNVVTRQDHRPLRKEMLRDLGFINPKKRHLRSKSPVRSRNKNLNRKK